MKTQSPQGTVCCCVGAAVLIHFRPGKPGLPARTDKSLMTAWLYEMCCHDLEVMSLNPSQVEIGVHVLLSKSYLNQKYHGIYFAVQTWSGITCGRVLKGELYTQNIGVILSAFTYRTVV